MARGIYFVFPSVTDDIILTWSLNTTPLVEAGRSDPFAPSVDGYTYAPPNLKKEVYVFRFYSTPDGTTLGTLLRTFYADGEMMSNTIETYHYVVDGPNSYDPASGQSQLRDERLLNKEFIVSSRGTGFRRPDEYAVFNDGTFGGFDLIVTDGVNTEQFNPDDTWTVQIIGEKTSAAIEEAAGVNEITANVAFDDSFLGVNNIALGSGAKITVTFPAFSGMANGKARFSTYGGTQRYLVLQFNGSDVVDYAGEERNYIYLAQNEMIELTFKDGVAYVTDDQTRYLEAGETVFTNKKTKQGTFLCDGSGTEYNIADFQRVIDNLPEEMKVSYADWNLTIDKTIGIITKTYYRNRGKFAIDDINGKFKFPDARGMSFRGLMEFDGTADTEMLSQGSGGISPQQHILHKHPAKEGDATTLFVKRKTGGPGGGYGLNVSGAGWELAEQLSGSDGGLQNRVDSLGKYVVVIL